MCANESFAGGCDFRALYENFCPETDASYIRPPFVMMKIAVPLLNCPAVDASFFPPLAPAVEPPVVAVPDAAAVMTTALTFAPNSKLPDVNSSKERLSWKKMISL